MRTLLFSTAILSLVTVLFFSQPEVIGLGVMGLFGSVFFLTLQG